jgi:hypothetical protein
MKILTAHQPVYLPWCGLIHKIALADEFVVFDAVQYLKKDWNNRNKIKTAQGPSWLTVPVKTHGKFDQLLIDVKIDNEQNWSKKHLRAFHLNYSKTPYFESYIDFFEDLYAREWEFLAELNNYILQFILSDLGIKIPIKLAHQLDFEGSKSALVQNMCEKLNADIYIFGALGKDYADINSFHQAGVQVYFQEYKHPKYPQRFSEFEPYMTIFDLMFNCGPSSLSILMSDNMDKQQLINSFSKKE